MSRSSSSDQRIRHPRLYRAKEANHSSGLLTRSYLQRAEKVVEPIPAKIDRLQTFQGCQWIDSQNRKVLLSRQKSSKSGKPPREVVQGSINKSHSAPQPTMLPRQPRTSRLRPSFLTAPKETEAVQAVDQAPEPVQDKAVVEARTNIRRRYEAALASKILKSSGKQKPRNWKRIMKMASIT